MLTKINNQLFLFEVILIDSKTSSISEKSIFNSRLNSKGHLMLQSFESNIEFKLNFEEQRINSAWVSIKLEGDQHFTKFSILKCEIIKNDKNQNVNIENKESLVPQSFYIKIFVGNGKGI